MFKDYEGLFYIPYVFQLYFEELMTRVVFNKKLKNKSLLQIYESVTFILNNFFLQNLFLVVLLARIRPFIIRIRVMLWFEKSTKSKWFLYILRSLNLIITSQHSKPSCLQAITRCCSIYSFCLSSVILRKEFYYIFKIDISSIFLIFIVNRSRSDSNKN